MIAFVLVILCIVAIASIKMVVQNADIQTKYSAPKMDEWGLDDAATPYTTTATLALQGGRIVEEHPTIGNSIRFGSNQSISIRGVLLDDQEVIKSGSALVASSKNLTYRKIGLVRIRAAEAIAAKYTRIVSAGNGDFRAFNAVTDTVNMILGRTEATNTAVGDYVPCMVDVTRVGV